MKLLFIHISEKVKEDCAGGLYTDGSYDGNIWNRYLNITDDISLLCRRDNHVYNVEEAKNKFNDLKNIKFIEVNNLLGFPSIISIKQRNEYKRILKTAIKEADAIIIRGVDKYAVRYIKKYKKKYIVEVVGCVFDSLRNYSLLGKIMAFPEMIKQKMIVKNADNVVYVTSKFLQKRYPTKGRNIGISDVNIGNVNNNILEKRLKRITCKNNIIIGTLGSIDARYKGQDKVIKVIFELKKMGINRFTYLIAGAGEGKKLKKLIKKYKLEEEIILCGNIKREDVKEWLDKIDIYVQPSKTEGMPRSLIEAMSRACCCFGTNVGGIPELLDKEYLLCGNIEKSLKDVLINIDEERIKSGAEFSFNKSREFNSDTLDKIRTEFYKDSF